VKVLGRLLRGKFLGGLARLFEQGELAITPRTPERAAGILAPTGFDRLKSELYAKDWVLYNKAPFRKPDALFRYLGLYTHRVAISNHRIMAVDDNSVTFRTRDKMVCQLRRRQRQLQAPRRSRRSASCRQRDIAASNGCA